MALVMDNIHDPHNVSAIMRSCDAFGVPLIYLYYTNECFPRMGRKSSGSARKWVSTENHSNPQKLMGKLISQGFQIIGTGVSTEASCLLDWDLTKSTAIVLGNEHRGVSNELRPFLDGQLSIPMSGMVESFNVSVAASIILYESWRQRYQKDVLASGGYDPETLNTMFQEWIQK